MKYLSKIIMPGLLVYGVLLGLLCIYNDYSISALMPLAPIVYGLVFGIDSMHICDVRICIKHPDICWGR